MDTTSTALALTLSLLAEHPDVQRQLRDEILGALGDRADLDYDELTNLPYLDAVVREGLRLYAPVTTTMRVATAPDMIPVSAPFRDARGREHEFSLDTHGFQFVRHVSAETEFVDEERIKGVYYKEGEELLKSVTGAKRVLIFDHTIR